MAKLTSFGFLAEYHWILFLVFIIKPMVTAAKECYTCEVATLDCDPKSNICNSDCKTKTTCEDDTMFCYLAVFQDNATSTDEPIMSAMSDCFPNMGGEIQEVTGDYCGVLDEVLVSYAESSASFVDPATHTCMCSGDSCNSAIYLLPGSNPPVETTPESFHDLTTKHLDPNINSNHQSAEQIRERHERIAIFALASIIPALIIGTIVVVIGYLYMTRCRKKTCFDGKDHVPTSNTESTSLDLTGDSDMKIITVPDGNSPSESPENPIHMTGDCLPLTLDAVIGRGRFGAVWKAQHKHGDGKTFLAVKVFQEFDSASWNVEKELFTDESVSLHHDNVVEFIAAEVRRAGYQQNKQFWLVTKYYSKGSVQDFLTGRTVTWTEFCRMSGSTARGVAHLHADVYGSHGLHKIPVSHRDLKSSNVLVKDNGECIIADFGLAIKLDPRISTDTLANSGQVGTPRYMSPEALESKVNLQDIESFKQMDIYSLALIIWEIATRCTLNTDMQEYVLPYDDLLTGYPSVEEMKTIVVQRGQRPAIPESWEKSTGMGTVTNTMMECWDADPEARLTASCVELRFADLISWVEGEQHLGHIDHSVTIV